MDTRTPPIPLKHQEKNLHPSKKYEHSNVSLPPLTPLASQRQKRKPLATPWNRRPPNIPQPQEYSRQRPYRVLHIGATPLMHACQQGDRARVLRLLKEQESTIGYRDRTLRSALHYCMDAGTGGAVAMTAPELVNAPDAEGHTPLHLAVIAGDTQLVAVLLANGADVNAKDIEGHSVLHWATVCGEAECVRLVLTSGARPSTPDLRGGSPLHYAAQCCGTTATAELSVPKKVGLKVLQTLLEYGADVNAKDEDGRQPILWAASAGSVEAVLALSRAGGSAAAGASDKDGLTALHCAASRGHARCVEALVNLCGSHPDHVDDNGCSALHYAATLGHADATALILKLGADPNRQDRKGRTPALCAAAKGQLETLKILAQHGGSLHARTVRGTGIAHEAVASGRIELMKWLAKKRPSILDVATQDGRTPLHVAALHGHLDACKVLLDHGARVNAVLRTSKNIFMTPLDAALHKGHRDCAKLIQMHGGTTAQQIRSHKLPQAKVFSRKLHPKDTDSSTESDSSPCRRKEKRPDLYYEERWIERRTRRRGRKIAKRDSRSFSEEELRLSKTSRRDCCERRARSESARYESEEGKKSSEEPVSPKKFSKRKNDRSSSKSDSLASRDDVSSDVSVSEDSLEVVVVRKSLERKEKIVSGRRSPRKVSRSRRKSSRRKGESSSKAKEARQGANLDENRSTLREEKSGKIHFERDITDSTSQENIQRVTVTAIVHKSPPPETPRISVEVSKEVSVDPSGRSGISKSESSKNGSVSEKENESHGAESPETKSQEPEAKISEEGLETEKKSESSVSKEESGQSRMEESPKIDTLKGETDKSDSQTRETPEVARDLESKEELSEKEEKKEVKNVEDSENVKLQKSSDSKEQSFDADKNSEGHRTEDEEEKDENGEENPSKSIEDENTRTDSEKSMESTNLDALAIGGTKGTPDEKKNETKSSKGSLDRKQSKAKLGRPMKSDESGKNVAKTEVEEDKDQVDSARGKSLEHSSRESSRTDTPKSQEKSGDASEKDENSPFREETKKFSAEEVSSKGSKTRRPSTGKGKRRSSRKLFQSSSKDRSPERSAIIAVIESPEWDEEDEEVEKEIRDVIGDDAEQDTEPEDDGIGVVRILPSTSEEEISRVRTSLPQVYPRNVRNQSPQKEQRGRLKVKQREDSGGRDSGIEPSPRVSRIPRRNVRCYPNSAKQQTLHMETVMRDVHISLRRYHLERKIFFQLMELKRLQIRHGRANEHVLVKRQVDSFNKSGMTGPTLGVVKYEQPLTFRDFESFLYEQLRRLQRRPATPDWCTEAKQCTQKTHRCHHATSAYTSLPVYTYLGGTDQECARSLLPKIESRGKGQMRVEVTHGEEKQVIALPTEKLDRTKRYFVTFTVRGETTFTDKPKSLINLQRSAKSV